MPYYEYAPGSVAADDMFAGLGNKAVIYVKDSASRQKLIDYNDYWGTNFSASNVLIK